MKPKSRWIAFVVRFIAAPFLGAIIVASAQTPLAQSTDNYPRETADDRILGRADAPITIFEYASLTCPHCAAFNADTLPRVKLDWIDTGKAKLIFRDYPLDRLALNAASVARCVPTDRFFEFIDSLFRNQANWFDANDSDKSLARVAKLSGLGQEQVDTCLKDDKLTNFIVGERFTADSRYGVKSTPTFFVNGKKVVGEVPYADLNEILRTATNR